MHSQTRSAPHGPRSTQSKKNVDANKIMFLIANFLSLFSKQDEFMFTVNATEERVVIGTEKLFLNDTFHLFCKDRASALGRDVLAVSKTLNATLITVQSDLKIVLARIELVPSPPILHSCYRPPGYGDDFCTKLYHCSEIILRVFSGCDVVPGGDFN